MDPEETNNEKMLSQQDMRELLNVHPSAIAENREGPDRDSLEILAVLVALLRLSNHKFVDLNLVDGQITISFREKSCVPKSAIDRQYFDFFWRFRKLETSDRPYFNLDDIRQWAHTHRCEWCGMEFDLMPNSLTEKHRLEKLAERYLQPEESGHVLRNLAAASLHGVGRVIIFFVSVFGVILATAVAEEYGAIIAILATIAVLGIGYGLLFPQESISSSRLEKRLKNEKGAMRTLLLRSAALLEENGLSVLGKLSETEAADAAILAFSLGSTPKTDLQLPERTDGPFEISPEAFVSEMAAIDAFFERWPHNSFHYWRDIPAVYEEIFKLPVSERVPHGMSITQAEFEAKYLDCKGTLKSYEDDPVDADDTPHLKSDLEGYYTFKVLQFLAETKLKTERFYTDIKNLDERLQACDKIAKCMVDDGFEFTVAELYEPYEFGRIAGGNRMEKKDYEKSRECMCRLAAYRQVKDCSVAEVLAMYPEAAFAKDSEWAQKAIHDKLSVGQRGDFPQTWLGRSWHVDTL